MDPHLSAPFPCFTLQGIKHGFPSRSTLPFPAPALLRKQACSTLPFLTLHSANETSMDTLPAVPFPVLPLRSAMETTMDSLPAVSYPVLPLHSAEERSTDTLPAVPYPALAFSAKETNVDILPAVPYISLTLHC